MNDQDEEQEAYSLAIEMTNQTLQERIIIAKRFLTEAREQEHNWLLNKFGDLNDDELSLRSFEMIQHESNHRIAELKKGL